jgi:flavin reductase (DIM6/NTAB) family NADH-FMN oxidoreductase RutF
MMGDATTQGDPVADLDVDPSTWQRRDLYHLVTSLVVPRPIAWVSTVSKSGVRNLAPHSYFNLVGSAPPHVVVGSVGVKDTVRNVRETGEFVVNLATVELMEQMNATGIDAPYEVDEFDLVGLEAEPSRVVRVPRVARSPVHLECRIRHELDLGGSILLVAEVVHVHVASRVIRDGAVDIGLLRPISRLGGTDYAEIGTITDLPRPRWTERSVDSG